MEDLKSTQEQETEKKIILEIKRDWEKKAREVREA